MFINKLLILKKLQQSNTHLGLPIGSKNFKWRYGLAASCSKAQSYILGFRGIVPVINLEKTIIALRRACNLIQLIVESNGHLLFINTNSKYNKIVRETAKLSNQNYINHKWIGGFLTNWTHMQNVYHQFKAITKLVSLESTLTSFKTEPLDKNVQFDFVPFSSDSNNCAPKNFKNKAILRFYENSLLLESPRYKKFKKCFEGYSLTDGSVPKPDCVIIFNGTQNSTAIYEAFLTQIPIIAIVDSNIPTDLYNLITYPIPANYDSVEFIYFFCNCLVKTILLSQKKKLHS
jgi:small subunit ribosomal protein S2